MDIPRAEHPRPQFRREQWHNLNGDWEFERDNGRSGRARGLMNPDAVFSERIVVPFCPQSRLSGIGCADFLYGVWYRRRFTITEKLHGQRTLLHFGAVDYRCEVFVNGRSAGTHQGGYVSFSFDITDLVREGENLLVVYAEDDERDPLIPRGKQSEEYFSHGCDYTRTTGIWQTVWLEFAPPEHIKSIRIYPNADAAALWITAELCGQGVLSVEAYYEGRLVARTLAMSVGGQTQLSVSLQEQHLWEPGHGRLYDLKLTYGDDVVYSYAGLRSLQLDKRGLRINNRYVFLRTVLDQGFYPDGIYTAPSDEALAHDIELAQSCGFNGARLHQKVFEERFLYHCDRLGYLVFGEYPNWGLDHTRADATFAILPEWLEEIDRDFNHPAIIGWCPFNETWDMHGCRQNDEVIRTVYLATKHADYTRPCIDTSGNYHVQTDIYDTHDYEQNTEVFRAHYDAFASGEPLWDPVGEGGRQQYDGQLPVFVSEYGGTGFGVSGSAWSYGDRPQTTEAFLTRFGGLTDTLLDNPRIMGLCYTQLTDIEQEQNGLFTFDRQPKFETAQLYDILARKAAMED